MTGIYLILFLFLLLLGVVCVAVYAVATNKYGENETRADWKKTVHWCAILLFSAISALVLMSMYSLNMVSLIGLLILRWQDFLVGTVVLLLLLLGVELVSPTRLQASFLRFWRGLLHLRPPEQSSTEDEESRALERRRNENDFDLAVKAVCYILLTFSFLTVGGILLMEAGKLTGGEAVIPIAKQVAVLLLFLSIPLSARQTFYCFRMLRENHAASGKKEENRIVELLKKDNTSL